MLIWLRAVDERTLDDLWHQWRAVQETRDESAERELWRDSGAALVPGWIPQARAFSTDYETYGNGDRYDEAAPVVLRVRLEQVFATPVGVDRDEILVQASEDVEVATRGFLQTVKERVLAASLDSLLEGRVGVIDDDERLTYKEWSARCDHLRSEILASVDQANASGDFAALRTLAPVWAARLASPTRTAQSAYNKRLSAESVTEMSQGFVEAVAALLEGREPKPLQALRRRLRVTTSATTAHRARRAEN